MLIVGSRLDNMPVMSLQTGGEIARISEAVINPANLEIVAYRLTGPLIGNHNTYVLINDIRELSEVGFIVDSADEFINDGDVIAIDNIIDRQFNLVGKPVISRLHKKLGKVIDYNIDIDSFTVIQIIVKRSLLHSFSETELIVHRSQIIEINDRAIIIEDGTVIEEKIERATLSGSYTNPFRNSKPAPEGTVNA
jgi:hypothetical protein